MNIELENYLHKIEEDIADLPTTSEYDELYENIQDKNLGQLFSKLHNNISRLVKRMNTRLPTFNRSNHYWAEESRDLILCIEVVQELYYKLRSTEYSFNIDSYYFEFFKKGENFLSKSGGSAIPLGMNKIEVYYTKPIFFKNETTVVKTNNSAYNYQRKLIGEGSYARVYSYKDEFYKKKFIVKVAKNDLTNEELERFEKEFYITKDLNSPYIIEVYSFDSEKNEYYMEYMDTTLYDYIRKYNTKLLDTTRYTIVNQILHAFNYIHSKNIFHRDISPKNILIKNYDNTVVAKVSDFGLVKIPDSSLTKFNTEIKGYFNDLSSLKLEGFNNYNMHHEIYALSYLIFFICTGKENIAGYSGKYEELIKIGMAVDKLSRPKNVIELKKLFDKIITK